MSAVPDAERRTRYAPVVPTVNFPVGFVLYAGLDVAVFIDGVERAQTDLTYPWSISATFVLGEAAAAQVVADGVGWSGVTVDIVGKIAPSRVDQFIDGAYIPAYVWNLIINRIVAGGRELFDMRERSLVLPFGETVTTPLPDVATRANMVFAFDADGQPSVADFLGEKGWSPTFAIVNDSARRVLQVVDWQGGEGTKPATGLYVGATGLVASIASGVDIRGPQGASGAGTGDMLAAQNLNDLVDKPTARTNLGLGSLATKSTITVAELSNDAVETAKIKDANVTAAKIAAGAVGAAALANMASGTVKARGSGGTGSPEDIAVGTNLQLDGTSLRSVATTLNTQTNDYTLVLADAGKVVEMNKATANNLTVPTNASVPFIVGTIINPTQMGIGQTTIVPAGGVTIRGRNGLKLAGQYALATLYKRDTDEWVLGGDVTT